MYGTILLIQNRLMVRGMTKCRIKIFIGGGGGGGMLVGNSERYLKPGMVGVGVIKESLK